MPKNYQTMTVQQERMPVAESNNGTVDIFSQNTILNPDLMLTAEPYVTNQQDFQMELQRFIAFLYGEGNTNLVVRSSDVMNAYLKFLQIGARDYPSPCERQMAILQQLTAEEFFRAMLMMREVQ